MGGGPRWAFPEQGVRGALKASEKGLIQAKGNSVYKGWAGTRGVCSSHGGEASVA